MVTKFNTLMKTKNFLIDIYHYHTKVYIKKTLDLNKM